MTVGADPARARAGAGTRQALPLLVIGPFPPPMHGFAVITAALADRLERGRAVLRHDLSSDLRLAPLRHLAQATLCLRAAFGILRFARRGGREIALGANGGLGLVYTLLLVATARLTGLRILLHHHSYAYINRRSALMAALCRIGGARVEHVFLAPVMQKDFAAHYPLSGPAHILPNAIFVPARPGPDLPRPLLPLRVGLLSNLGAEKGLYDFLETARAVKAAGLPVEMLLAGPAPRPDDAKAIRDAEAEGILRYCGPLYGADKTGFFDTLDLFLFPTRYRHEAQPTVIYEALASGVPVMANARGTVADQVLDCLSAVQAKASFSVAALSLIQELVDLEAQDRARLRASARARHAEDSAKALSVLRSLGAEG